VTETRGPHVKRNAEREMQLLGGGAVRRAPHDLTESGAFSFGCKGANKQHCTVTESQQLGAKCFVLAVVPLLRAESAKSHRKQTRPLRPALP